MKPSDFAAHAVDLLEELVRIPSVTGSETVLVDFVEERLRTGRGGWTIESIPVSAGRRDLFVHADRPRIVLTTHADTVPPYFSPRREGNRLFARGACDAKASLACQMIALEELRETGELALLLVVGEERGSDGALAASRRPPTSARYLVGGEPTENRFVAGSKGCLRVAIETLGVAAHSSLDGGSSAVPPLLDLLDSIRALESPSDPVFGETTLNIGVIAAGTAPNVVAERARAELLFRTGQPVEELLRRIERAAGGIADVEVPYRSDPIRFRVPRGEHGDIVAFACDLPLLPGWGEPILVGPGSIRHAHAADESIELEEVEKGYEIYRALADGLSSLGNRYLEPAP